MLKLPRSWYHVKLSSPNRHHDGYNTCCLNSIDGASSPEYFAKLSCITCMQINSSNVNIYVNPCMLRLMTEASCMYLIIGRIFYPRVIFLRFYLHWYKLQIFCSCFDQVNANFHVNYLVQQCWNCFSYCSEYLPIFINNHDTSFAAVDTIYVVSTWLVVVVPTTGNKRYYRRSFGP